MSQLEVDKIIPQSGTTLTIGDSGDTITISSGAGFQSNGIYDNSSSTSLFINGSNRVTIGTDSGYGLDNSADDFVVANILSNSGMSIVSNASNSSSIFFTDTGVSSIGKIVYSHSSDDMKFTTANSEAMRIDSSGNLLVGKTNNDLSNDGIVIREGGEILATNTSGFTANFNRLSTDGRIVVFYKDGTEVGSTGVDGGDLLIGTGDTGIRFYDAVGQLLPRTTSGGASNNSIDLGSTVSNFRDLYLGGGLYVGGTGTANHLDDYEEGTWTPTTNIGYATIYSAIYVKIGRLVFAHMNVVTNTGPGDVAQATTVSGLPFSAKSSADQVSNNNIIVGLNQDVYAQISGTSFAQRDRADNVIVTRGEYGNKTHRCSIVYYTDD